MTDCERLREYYEEYALGVLEGEERSEIAAHLARRCSTCTLGVEEARRLIGQLAFMAPEAEPPAEIRRKLNAAIARHPADHGWMPTWVWAGAVAALLLISLFAAQQMRSLQKQYLQLAAQYLQLTGQLRDLNAQAAAYRRAIAIASSSGTKSIALASTQPAAPQVRAFWNETSGLVLIAQKMPGTAAGRTYQLWVVPKQGKPISAGIFRPDNSGSVLIISGAQAKIADAAALAISDEPAGGSPQPSTTPIWVGPLS